ncbi:hypothetical protein FXO37_33648 [Capsicum annuum]|nr:hypothetical protein FXO37_33648 [Capsicum annuum]
MAQCEKSKVINVRTTIGSSTKMFLWRPYTLALEGWLVPKLYKENGEWTIVERRQNVDQELESFIRFLRVSELVGLDCQEHYRPSRVALQRKNSHIHDAPDNNESSSVVLSKWNEENDKENLSIGVCQTVACDIVPPGSAKNQTHCEQAILFPATECQLKQVEDYPDVPPGFPPKC